MTRNEKAEVLNALDWAIDLLDAEDPGIDGGDSLTWGEDGDSRIALHKLREARRLVRKEKPCALPRR